MPVNWPKLSLKKMQKNARIKFHVLLLIDTIVLIAHRDIRQYVPYTNSRAPKAFVVAACSGQSFWLEQQTSQQSAEKKALEQCELNRQASDPCCTLLESE